MRDGVREGSRERERDVKLKNVRFWSRSAVKTKIPFLTLNIELLL